MLHSLCRMISRSMCSVALLSVIYSSTASAQLRHWVAPEREAPAPVSHYATPADLQLIPFLKAHTAAKENGNESLQPMGTPYVDTPSFGGYVNAPMYDARTTASLATGVFNNGVTVELGADFDKDGKPDIAVFQQDGTLNVLMNNGKGGLKAPISYLNPNYQSGNINNAYAVDINGDGYADIVAFDYNNNTTITWLNLGDGTFNAAVTTPLDTTYGYPNMIYLADVNGDGKADLLFGTIKLSGRTSATVYLETQLGKGDGTFGDASTAKVQSFTFAASGIMPETAGIAVADINGDGKADIALVVDERFSSTTGKYVVTTALGKGDGTFSSLGTVQPIAVDAVANGIQATVSYKSSILTFSDVNGDGKLDLVADINGVIEVAPGNGDGSFGAVLTSPATAAEDVSQSVLVDVNGDGKPDLIATDGTLAIHLGKGDGTFAAPVAGSQYIIDPGGSQSMVLADFNNDGIQDIAQLGDDYKQVSIFLGDGKGTLRGAPVVTANSNPNSLYTSLLSSGKYTASGYTSPLLAYRGGSSSQLVTNVSDGKGNFTSVQALANFPADLQYIQPIHADFNGDGLEDLVYANNAGKVFVALAKGDGSFSSPIDIGLPTASCPVYYAAAGDINGDGKADIVIPYGGDAACSASDGGVSGYYVALGKGDGTFTVPAFTATGTELYSLTLADINNDGNLDLVINDAPLVSGSGFNISIALGNGDGSFADSSLVVENYLVSKVAVADINNDGKLDLVLSSEEIQGNTVETGGIVLITGNGDGTFNAPSQIATGNFFYDLQVADMNSDGNADIVATLYSTNGQPKNYYGMITLLGYGNGQFSAPVNQLESLNSTLLQVGHFYNDGALDAMTETGYGPALFIGQGGVSITLTSSAPSIIFGQAETLTATLTAGLAGRPAATGNVSFYDGVTLLGSATVNAGKAAFTTSQLMAGKHTIKAVYTGDSNFNPSTSTISTVTVATLAPAFTLTSTPGAVAVTRGSQGIVTLSLAANAAFSGDVTLTCSGMPVNGTCFINPGSITLSAGNTTTATLVIGTTGTHAALEPTHTPWKAPATTVALGVLLCMTVSRRKARLLSVLGVVLLISLSTVFTGCSDSNKSSANTAPTTPAGSYTVTITATPASGSSASVQTASVAVTVK